MVEELLCFFFLHFSFFHFGPLVYFSFSLFGTKNIRLRLQESTAFIKCTFETLFDFLPKNNIHSFWMIATFEAAQRIVFLFF